MAAPQPDINAPAAALHPSLIDPRLASATDDHGQDFYLSSWNSWDYPAEVGVMPWDNLDVWAEHANTWEELAHPDLLCVPIDTLDEAAADLMMMRVPGMDGLWQRVQTRRAMNGPLVTMTDPPTQAPEPDQAPMQDPQSLTPAASTSSSTQEPSASASLHQQSQLAIRTRCGLTQAERDHVVSRCTASPKVTRFDVAFDIVAARGGQVIDAVSMSQIAALLVQYGRRSELESGQETDDAKQREAVGREVKEEGKEEEKKKKNKKKHLVKGKEVGAGALPQPQLAPFRKKVAGHKTLTKKACPSSRQSGAAPGKAQLAHKQDKNSNAGSSESKRRSTMTNKKRRKR